MAEGETIAAIMASPHMLGRRTLFDELKRDPAFASTYAVAREVALEVMEDEMKEIADTPQPSVTRITRPD